MWQSDKPSLGKPAIGRCRRRSAIRFEPEGIRKVRVSITPLSSNLVEESKYMAEESAQFSIDGEVIFKTTDGQNVVVKNASKAWNQLLESIGANYYPTPKNMFTKGKDFAGSENSQQTHDSANVIDLGAWTMTLDTVVHTHNEYCHDFENAKEIVAEASWSLPGIREHVFCPCRCENYRLKKSIHSIIIHLNDSDKWSREEIADWIDKLHDDGIINAEFQPWEEESETQG